MPTINVFDSIFAVLDESNKKAPNLIGTAFPIGKGVFATAGHVVKAIQNISSPTLRKFEQDGETVKFPIKQGECWNNIDFGLLLADFQPKSIFSWLDAKVIEPTNVYTIGFAFGLEINLEKLVMRHFKGHVVSCRKYDSWDELLNKSKDNSPKYPFGIYELSFACPLCQSGAPLLAKLPDGVSVIGCIVGNSSSRMEVISSVEQESDTEKTERYEYHEFLHLGQAISGDSLLQRESILLGNLSSKEKDNSRKKLLREHLGDSVRKVIINK